MFISKTALNPWDKVKPASFQWIRVSKYVAILWASLHMEGSSDLHEEWEMMARKGEIPPLTVVRGLFFFCSTSSQFHDILCHFTTIPLSIATSPSKFLCEVIHGKVIFRYASTTDDEQHPPFCIKGAHEDCHSGTLLSSYKEQPQVLHFVTK